MEPAAYGKPKFYDFFSDKDIDGAARPQIVSRETNPRYWNLINESKKPTGIPMLVNTSLNVRETIVCTPEDE